MERTESDIIRTTSPQMYEIAHNLNDIGCVDYALNCFPVDCGTGHMYYICAVYVIMLLERYVLAITGYIGGTAGKYEWAKRIGFRAVSII